MAEDSFLIGSVTLVDLLVFLFVFIATLSLGSTVYILSRRFLDCRLPESNSKPLSRLLEYSIIVAGLYYGLYHVLGLDITAFAASLGILTVAIAFSSQQIIQNVMAGIIIAIDRPIQIGDWVEVGGIPLTGMNRVRDIKLMKTVMRDRDARLIYIPNSLLITSKIINYSRAGFLEVPVQMKVPYTSNYEKIKDIILETANENKRILPLVTREEKSNVVMTLKLPHIQKLFDSAPDMKRFRPRVLISEVSDSQIILSARIWIREVEKRDEIVSEFLDSLLNRFRKEKIKLD